MKAPRLLLGLTLLVGTAAHAELSAQPKIAATQAALRDLWVGHIFWVRNVALQTFANNKDAAAEAEKEVVANAKSIGAAIEPFYGKEAGDKLFTLLAGHWAGVKAHITA